MIKWEAFCTKCKFSDSGEGTNPPVYCPNCGKRIAVRQADVPEKPVLVNPPHVKRNPVGGGTSPTRKPSILEKQATAKHPSNANYRALTGGHGRPTSHPAPQPSPPPKTPPTPPKPPKK